MKIKKTGKVISVVKGLSGWTVKTQVKPKVLYTYTAFEEEPTINGKYIREGQMVYKGDVLK